MRVLIACEFSGIVRSAFRARGHDAWSCDLLSAEDGSPFHIQGDALKNLEYSSPANLGTDGWRTGARWDLLIAHPPCTYLTNSGVRWLSEPDSDVEPLKGRPRWEAMKRDAAFFCALRDAPIARKCIENPIMHVHAYNLIGSRATQFIQPWQFGHKEIKATGFHLTNLPKLVPTSIVGPPPQNAELRRTWARVHQASPGPDRWKERSRTLPGIAAAMAEQWGAL